MGHAIEAIDPDLKSEDAWHAMVSRAFDINETYETVQVFLVIALQIDMCAVIFPITALSLYLRTCR